MQNLEIIGLELLIVKILMLVAIKIFLVQHKQNIAKNLQIH